LLANRALRPDQAEQLRNELTPLLQPIKELAKLGENTTGRYPRPAEATALLNRPFPSKAPQTAANLLWFDAVLQTHDSKTEDALTDACAVLLVGRTVGDEPDMIAQAVRMSCRRKACTAIQRILAQRPDAKPEALLATQKLLATEEADNLLRQGLRGDRVWVDELMQQTAAGNMAIDSLDGEPKTWDRINNWLQGGRLLESRARCLKLLTEAVTLAGEPLESQVEKFGAFRQTVADLRDSRRFLLAHLALQTPLISVEASHATQTQLRCAITGLAAEQYRLRQGSWPDSLEKLVPNYLPAVPIDPFDRQPLKLRSGEDGITIVSVGPNGKEIQFRLWNVDQRNLPSR
jgi:hypothetical protein